jgi:hypothetical protein
MTPMPFTFVQISPPEAARAVARSSRAKGETKGSRRKVLNFKTLPTREAPDDLA